MIPLISTVGEFENQKNVVDNIAKRLNKNLILRLSMLGTMIELPRACLTADNCRKADFLFWYK